MPIMSLISFQSKIFVTCNLVHNRNKHISNKNKNKLEHLNILLNSKTTYSERSNNKVMAAFYLNKSQ